MFEKKYRVISNDTGPGGDFVYRSKYIAAFWAATFEYTEWRAGIRSNGWRVQEKVKPGTGRHAYLLKKGKIQ